MNRGTILWVLAAVVGVTAVVLTTPGERPAVVARDEGELLCPALTDPAAVTRLEVRRWNTEDAQAERFVVEQRDGVWTIPSHGGYPAEATDRMARAASSLVGVTKGVARGERPEQHAEFGVLDPDDPAAADEGKGDRIVLTDPTGAVLADVIVGKPVPGQSGAQRRFVRLADSNRVYEAVLGLDVSTRFADWIDPDVLDLRRDEIVSMTLHAYRVDESSGRVLGDDPLRLTKRSATTRSATTLETSEPAAAGGGEPEWSVDGASKAGKRLDSAKLNALLDAIDQMTIVGVRPQPEMLTDVALRSKGFFVSPERIFGNEGELEVSLADGTRLNILFGEVAPSSGLALTAGGADGEAATPPTDGEGPRYVFIMVGHPGTTGASGSGEASSDNTERSQATGAGAGPANGRPEGDGVVGGEAAGGAAAGAPERAPPVAGSEGVARAEALQRRFSRWFFVIDGATFDKMRPMPQSLFADADAPGQQP